MSSSTTSPWKLFPGYAAVLAYLHNQKLCIMHYELLKVQFECGDHFLEVFVVSEDVIENFTFIPCVW